MIIKTKIGPMGSSSPFGERELLAFRQNLGERLAYVIDIMGTKSAVAAAASVTTEQLNKWVKGTVKVPVEALKAISAASEVDFSWLATGGSQIPPSKGAFQHQEAGRPVQLPQFDIHASAGLGLPVGDEIQMGVVAFDRGFLKDRGANPDQCSVITASGDSMQPAIPDGSMLVVDHSQTEVKNGLIMVVNVGDDLLVKRIRRRLDGLIDLISDNPLYPPETLGPNTLEQLRVVGRVVYFCRTP